jgi:hypothetical protein
VVIAATASRRVIRITFSSPYLPRRRLHLGTLTEAGQAESAVSLLAGIMFGTSLGANLQLSQSLLPLPVRPREEGKDGWETWWVWATVLVLHTA